MNRLQVLSIALSACCGAGVLMVAILANNGQRMPVISQMVPTKNPIMRLEDVPVVLPRTVASEKIPAGVDPVVTSSIRKPTKRNTHRNISDIIGGNEESARKIQNGAKTVIVKPGDSLFAIARRSGVNTKLLAEINSLEAPFIIRPGQILHLRRN